MYRKKKIEIKLKSKKKKSKSQTKIKTQNQKEFDTLVHVVSFIMERFLKVLGLYCT